MVFALLAGPTFAATWNVPADGDLDDVWGEASDGDTILIDAITETHLPSQLDKRITVVGAGAGSTVLDVSGEGSPALSVTVAVTLRDLTIDGDDQVALLEKHNAETLTLERVELLDGEDLARSGGALWIDDGAVIATDTSFVGNAAHEGGAVRVDAGEAFTCDRCTFLDNRSDGAIGDGGALWLAGSATLTDTVFEANVAPEWHGGAISVNAAGALTVFGGAFLANVSGGDGGAIVIRANGSATVAPSVSGPTSFTGQVALAGGGLSCMGFCDVAITGATFSAGTATNGGHLYNTVGELDVTDTVLEGGSASDDGGAVWAMKGTFTRVRMCDNTATDQGGAVWALGDVSLRNVALLRNTADVGGGAHLEGDADLAYATLLGNAATTGAGTWSAGAVEASVWADHATLAADGATTVTDGATWGNTADFGNQVVVVSAAALSTDPFLPPAATCGWPVPQWAGELWGAGTVGELDPDGSPSDGGATGGPDADPSLWADVDGDGVAAMWDCDDADPTVGLDCEPPAPPDTGAAGDTSPSDTGGSPPDTGGAPPDTGGSPSDTGSPRPDDGGSAPWAYGEPAAPRTPSA
ncbi:MAG: hypothetical protein ABMA64_30935, partial [Myxococcota bacterium]